MNFKITNVNYAATIVELKEFVPIPGKDKIQGALIFGNHVIVSKDLKLGDLGIYFPVECKINPEFLKANNLFKTGDLNADPKLKGFFERSCRVKALKLAGVKSEGFWIPIKSIASFFKPEDFKSGDEFNFIDDREICTKYVIKFNNPVPTSKSDKRKKRLKRFNQVIENQFNFHIDTSMLNKNIHKLKPTDIISITNKLHGTSAIFCDVLVKRKLSIFERVLKWFGVRIETSQYGNIYSSRGVIKNQYLNTDKQQNHFYNEDIWGTVNNKLKDTIPKSFTIYGEIVGYLSTGAMIQKGYHYSCEASTHKFYVYRITNTNADGLVIELSWQQLKEFCNKYNLTIVPEFYYGVAKDLFPDIPINETWNSEFLKRLSMSFNMNDSMCELNNKEVPAEGLVLRIDNLFNFDAYKLKNFAFKAWESKQLDDENTIDIEAQEAEDNEIY